MLKLVPESIKHLSPKTQEEAYKNFSDLDLYYMWREQAQYNGDEALPLYKELKRRKAKYASFIPGTGWYFSNKHRIDEAIKHLSGFSEDEAMENHLRDLHLSKHDYDNIKEFIELMKLINVIVSPGSAGMSKYFKSYTFWFKDLEHPNKEHREDFYAGFSNYKDLKSGCSLSYHDDKYYDDYKENVSLQSTTIRAMLSKSKDDEDLTLVQSGFILKTFTGEKQNEYINVKTAKEAFKYFVNLKYGSIEEGIQQAKNNLNKAKEALDRLNKIKNL